MQGYAVDSDSGIALQAPTASPIEHQVDFSAFEDAFTNFLYYIQTIV
jgi:hypothetical protein